MSSRRRKNPMHECGHDAFDHVKDGAGPCSKCECKGCKPLDRSDKAARDNRKTVDETKMRLARQQLFAEISQSVDRFLKNVISVSEGGKISIPTITPSKRKTSFSSVGEILATIGTKEVTRAEVTHAGAASKGALREKKRALPGEGSGSDLAAEGTRADETIVKVLVQYGPSSRKRVALLARYSHKSGSFGQALARLRAAGFIEGSAERLVATDAGAMWCGSVPPLPRDPEALLAHWRARLDEGPARILMVLGAIARYPRVGGSSDLHGKTLPITRSEIAELAEYSERSGSFGQSLATLRRLGLITGSSKAIDLAKELR